MDAPKDFGLRVFLSYSHADVAQADKVREAVQANGHKAWCDSLSLVGGQDWALEIRNAIRGSDIVLVCLSAQVVYARSYVHKEWRLALDVQNELPHGAIYIVPLRFDNCLIPKPLQGLQCVDWFQEDGRHRLLASLSEAGGLARKRDQPERPLSGEPVGKHLPLKRGHVWSGLRDFVLREVSHRCSICRTSPIEDVFLIDAEAKLEFKNMIALCPGCYERVSQERLSVSNLRALQSSAQHDVRIRRTAAVRTAEVEQLLAEARMLMLSASDVSDITRARVMCEVILHRDDPFNVDARVLLERLRALEIRMSQDRGKSALRYLEMAMHELCRRYPRAFATIGAFFAATFCGPLLKLVAQLVGMRIGDLSGYLLGAASLVLLSFFRRDVIVALLLPVGVAVQLSHETGHLIAIYLSGGVKNAAGQKLPFIAYFKYIEINGLPFSEGVRDALKGLKRGEYPGFSVNVSRMHDEWYGNVSGLGHGQAEHFGNGAHCLDDRNGCDWRVHPGCTRSQDYRRWSTKGDAVAAILCNMDGVLPIYDPYGTRI